MESFAGLLQKEVSLRLSECFVEVDARFPGGLTRNTNVDTEQQSTTTTRWEEYHSTALDILSDIHAHRLSFVPAWKVMEENRCGNSFIFWHFSIVVGLHAD